MSRDVIELHNLSVVMLEILAGLDESGGELTPEVEHLLGALGETADAKVAELALACEELKRSAACIEGAEFRLRDRKRAVRACEERLREAIRDHMVQTGTEKVRTDLVTVSIRDLDPEPIWDGKPERIPDEFRTTLVEHRVNKEAVLRFVSEEGRVPEGMRMVDRKSIRIT